MTTNEGLQLFRSGRFIDAIAAFRLQLVAGGNRPLDSAGLGEAFLAACQYTEAISPLSEAGDYEKKSLPGSMGRDQEIAVCLWLSKNREQGIALMKCVVEGLNQGSISYANDLVGGLKHGIQFYYMAVTIGDRESCELAEAFVRKLTLSKKAKNWPGPVGQLVLGLTSIEQVLETCIGTPDLFEAIRLAPTDLMKRRKLVNVLFGAATASRISGDEAQCLEFMRQCSSLENPLIEYEWHFARAEVM